MINKFVVFILLAILPASFASLISSEPKELLPPVVKIGCDEYWGSGFFIDESRVATAAHIVRSCGGNLSLIDWGVPLDLINIDYDVDLAVLESNTKGRYFALNERNPQIGSDIWIEGFPGPDGVFVLTKGITSGIDKNNLFLTDARCFYGNSGGPAFNHNNKIVGVVVQIEPYSMTLCRIVPVEDFKKFLNIE